MSPKKGHLSHDFRTSWLDAKLDAVAYDRFAFRCFMIVSVVAASVWVGFVGIALLRPAATPPEKVAALPPLGLPALPAAADPSGPSTQATDSDSEATPFGSDAPQVAGAKAVPAPAPAAGKFPLPPARKASGRNDAAPAAKPITITIRTFHPPVIPNSYKDMVADKLKEAGLDSRLEAKVRNGQQLTKGDLASVPKSVMERLNQQVVAYGQPPLYTDTTTTTLASAAH